MIKRSTWIVLAVFIALLGLLWLLEWSPAAPARKSRVTPAATRQPALLQGINSANILRIQIQTTDGVLIAVSRGGDKTWAYEQAGGSPVDPGKVEELLSVLLSLRPQTSVDPSVTLDAVGLTGQPLIITLNDAAAQLYTFKFGRQTAINSGYYVSLNDQSPVVVSNDAMEPVIRLTAANALSQAPPTGTVEP